MLNILDWAAFNIATVEEFWRGDGKCYWDLSTQFEGENPSSISLCKKTKKKPNKQKRTKKQIKSAVFEYQ